MYGRGESSVGLAYEYRWHISGSVWSSWTTCSYVSGASYFCWEATLTGAGKNRLEAQYRDTAGNVGSTLCYDLYYHPDHVLGTTSSLGNVTVLRGGWNDVSETNIRVRRTP